MMPANKPFEYDCLKTVIKHMDPNLRFQLSRRVPSIRTAERVTPLKLKALTFENLITTVNETSYRISLYRKYQNGYPIPPEHRIENRDGIDEDLTEHGFVISSTVHDMTPGDLKVTPSRGFATEKEEVLGDSQEELEHYERCVKIYDEALANRRGKNIPCNGFKLENPLDWIPNTGTRDQTEATDQILVKTLTEYSSDNLRRALKICKAKLIPFYSRRDNSPLPFTPMLQLTVQSPGGQKIYQFSYNMKLREAMKKLNIALLGGYRKVIQLRIMYLSSGIIRLPVGLRMKIERLQMEGDIPSNYESLKTALDEASFPLDSLIMTEEYGDPNRFAHPVVQNASHLYIRIEDRLENFMPILLNLPNKLIIFNCAQGYLHVDLQILLIQLWIGAIKEVGTMLVYAVNDVQELMDEIEERQLGVVREEHLAYIPIDGSKRLRVSCRKKKDNNGIGLEASMRWIVTLKVVANQ